MDVQVVTWAALTGVLVGILLGMPFGAAWEAARMQRRVNEIAQLLENRHIALVREEADL